MPNYFKYLLKIEKWKSQHANKRYTYEYYAERMSKPYVSPYDPAYTNTGIDYNHGLSPKTLVRYNRIIDNINNILYPVTDPVTGISRPDKLPVKYQAKLKDWQTELENLQNPYEPDGTYKDPENRKMAFELRAWNKWIGERTNSTVDMRAFEE
jgi:hypothetical protein